ncbi:MAG: hypothetical protein N2690_00995, partial [Rhodocyclaceae bacterium]|nr:hypothetical protein [Rhodocyclaceae bacterium]
SWLPLLLHSASVTKDNAEAAILVYFTQGIQLIAIGDKVCIPDRNDEFSTERALHVRFVCF